MGSSLASSSAWGGSSSESEAAAGALAAAIASANAAEALAGGSGGSSGSGLPASSGGEDQGTSVGGTGRGGVVFGETSAPSSEGSERSSEGAGTAVRRWGAERTAAGLGLGEKSPQRKPTTTKSASARR